MSITLTAEQQSWLESEVAAGRLSSVEDAVRMAVADFKTINIGDLSWLKPYVDQDREAASRGEVISGEEFLRRLKARTSSRRST